MKKYTAALLLFATLILLSCMTETSNEAGNSPIRMPINPNGDSELALLMRDMFEDGMLVKAQIQQGELPRLMTDFEKIHTAEATEPEKAASPAYKVYALSYMQAVNALKNADKNTLEKSYTDMVDACMNCHKALCPGPMVRVKKMYLDQ